MDWSAHHNANSVGTKTRCRKCWNARCAEVYHARKAAGLATYVRKQRPVHTCSTCQAYFEVRGTARKGTRCAPCQQRADAERRGADFARRKKVIRNGDRTITWRSVGERDGWVCHLCHLPVKRKADSPHDPKSATVDHILPIAAGGQHEWSNVALAHWLCNVSRGAGGHVQLRLVG
jgi:5-methylcytosine-specific restriction endonuclease McrA